MDTTIKTVLPVLPQIDLDDLKSLPITYRNGILNHLVSISKITKTQKDEIVKELNYIRTDKIFKFGDYKFLNGKGNTKLIYNQPCDRCYLTTNKMINPNEFRVVFYPREPTIGKPEHYCLTCVKDEEIDSLKPIYQRQFYKVINQLGITRLTSETIANVKDYLLDLREKGIQKIPITAIATVAGVESQSCGWSQVKKICNEMGWHRTTKTGTHAAVKHYAKVVAAYADHLAIEE